MAFQLRRVNYVVLTFPVAAAKQILKSGIAGLSCGFSYNEDERFGWCLQDGSDYIAALQSVARSVKHRGKKKPAKVAKKATLKAKRVVTVRGKSTKVF